MKFDKFFALAKENGLSAAQIQIARRKSTSISLFHHEIENFSIENTQSIVACGIYNGKFGTSRTEKLGPDTFLYLINGIKESARVNEKDETIGIFKGSDKYHKKNVYNKSLGTFDAKDAVALLHRIEDGLYAFDKRITDVDDTGYALSEREEEFYNSYGLKLKQRKNSFYVGSSAVAKQGNEVKTNYDIYIGNDPASFDEKELIRKIAEGTISKFGGVQCDSGKFPTVLKNDVFADLASYFIESTSSDEVQRKSSFLAGKLGQKIASSKVTIAEKPLTKNIFFSYFDDEGVASYNKDIIKRGVLKTYLYNRETAKKDGVESTSNGTWAGNKIGIGFGNIFINGSKKTFDELIAPVKDGVYITEIAGLGTGMNSQSGNFSCQAQGFMIKDGKLASPLNLITLSGNLLAMFKGVKGFDNNVVMEPTSISCADVLINKMSIGGK